MATGKEIKRLRGKTSAGRVADLIGVGVDRLRKWEERDSDPSDSGDVSKVERYFGVPLGKLRDLKTFDFVEFHKLDTDYKDKYIASLERENQRLQNDLETNSAELMARTEVIAGVQAAMMEILMVIASKEKASYNKTVEILRKHKLEGSFV
jgi:hypothetical protein